MMPRRTTRTHPQIMVWLLSLLMGLQPVGTDFYLPALPSLVADLSATLHQGQLTLTAMLLGFGSSQLLWGPASDRWGRRPTLRLGLAMFGLAALLSVLAPTIEVLLVLRVAQGIGMGAVVVNARAIVRDHFSTEDGPRAMSQVMSGLGVFACVSGPLGGVLAMWFGWRAVLFAVSAIVFMALWQVWRRFSETLAERNPDALRLGHMMGNWRAVLSHAQFWAFTLQSIATFFGLFLFLATSSFIVTQGLGYSQWGYGLVMFGMSSSYIAGTFLCRRLMSRVGLPRTVKVGGVLSLLGGGVMLGGHLWAAPSVWWLMAPVSLFAAGHGIHQAIGQTGAVTPFPRIAGTAAALSGFMQMGFAFAGGALIGDALSHPQVVLAWGLLGAGVALMCITWVLIPWLVPTSPAVVVTRTPAGQETSAHPSSGS